MTGAEGTSIGALQLHMVPSTKFKIGRPKADSAIALLLGGRSAQPGRNGLGAVAWRAERDGWQCG